MLTSNTSKESHYRGPGTIRRPARWYHFVALSHKQRITVKFHNKLIIRHSKYIRDLYSFKLQNACNRVDRGNLVLRHFTPHYLPSSEGIACWVEELNALCLDSKAKKWKYKIFHLLECDNRTHNLYSHSLWLYRFFIIKIAQSIRITYIISSLHQLHTKTLRRLSKCKLIKTLS